MVSGREKKTPVRERPSFQKNFFGGFKKELKGLEDVREGLNLILSFLEQRRFLKPRQIRAIRRSIEKLANVKQKNFFVSHTKTVSEISKLIKKNETRMLQSLFDINKIISGCYSTLIHLEMKKNTPLESLGSFICSSKKKTLPFAVFEILNGHRYACDAKDDLCFKACKRAKEINSKKSVLDVLRLIGDYKIRHKCLEILNLRETEVFSDSEFFSDSSEEVLEGYI